MTELTASRQDDQLIDYLKRFKLSQAAIDLIQQKITPIHLQKGETFTQYGKNCRRIGLLVSGLLYASYQPENDGDEIVSRFFYAPDNIIVTSFESFHTEKPSNESIIAIEESYLICLDRKDLYELYENNPEINYVGRQLAEQSYIQALRRVHDLQTMNARQRVKDFLKKHPELFNRVKRQQMASYLGMNRNALTKFLNEC
jgi:CRP-like cAMP-binding protein